jgi:hypothetical protein
MAGKYAPLEHYLKDLPSTQKEVTLSFPQIEEILKSKLPTSAYEDNRWWELPPLSFGHLLPKSTAGETAPNAEVHGIWGRGM